MDKEIVMWFDEDHCVESIEKNEGEREVWKW